MALSRRDVLKLGALSGAALTLPVSRMAGATTVNRLAASRLPVPFTVPFAIPPLLRPVRSDATTDYYSMTMRQSSTSVVDGLQTPLWGYNGIAPGPTVKVNAGRQAVVRQINRLPSAHPTLGYQPWTSVHLHGSASLPQYDGYASDVTLPGQYKDYRYPNTQEARTLWYHDHGVMHTGPNVYMGLAGQYQMHDAHEMSLPIPQGRYDVPLIVSDLTLAADGTRLWNDNDESGIYGDIVLVNGRPWPVMKVERRKYRFRILNASVSRSYRWQLDSGEPLVVIATDGGLTQVPRPVQNLRHGMAERYEVIIDFAKYRIGQRVVLQNLSNRNNIDYPTTRNVMAFDVAAQSTSKVKNAIPDVLNPDDPTMALTEADAVATRRMDLVRSGGQWTINGKTWADVIESGYKATFANPALNSVEVWEITNLSGGWHHPLHIHLIDFRVLSRNGGPPMPYENGPKDVVYVAENERVKVAARFGPHQGRYMIHCHNLVHEDHDMMTQFEVGTDGDDPITSAPSGQLPAPRL